MEGSSDSGTGAAEQVGRRLEARALAAAERARQHGPQKRSEQSRRSRSDDGEWVERGLRMGHVPELYRDAVWDRVRSPAIREWTFALDGRAQRLGGRSKHPNWQVLGHGLMILGPVGTGKSSAAALVCQEAARLEKSIRWSYVPDLADLIAQTAATRSKEIALQEAADLLVWDDFGVRDLADWEIGYLDQIVETRYRRRKPMVVTSNWTADDFRDDPRLARMVDRWRERTASNLAVLAGESMRNVR